MSEQEPTPDQLEATIRSVHWNRNERIRLTELVGHRDREIASLKAELKSRTSELEKRIAYSERREATLDDDYQAARREVTVLSTLIDQIMDTCKAALSQATVAKHGYSGNNSVKPDDDMTEEMRNLVATGLGLDPDNLPVPPPPLEVHVQRPNRLEKFIHDGNNPPRIPEFLRRGPATPEEREPPQDRSPLAALADMLTQRGGEPLVPRRQEE